MHEEPSVTLCHNGSGSCSPYLTHNLKAEVLTVVFLREGWYNEVYKETTFLSKRNQTSPPFFYVLTYMHFVFPSRLHKTLTLPLTSPNWQERTGTLKLMCQSRSSWRWQGSCTLGVRLYLLQSVSLPVWLWQPPPASWDRRISLCLSHVLKCVFENLPLLLFYRPGFCGGEVGIIALSNSNWQKKPKSL